MKSLTENEQILAAVKVKMNSVEMYSDEWFKLKEEWQALFKKIEKEGR